MSPEAKMSIRSNSRPNGQASSGASTAIDFKDEFSNSTAALAASHDETVSHILSRLDQLQSKISSSETPTPAASSTPPARTSRPDSDLHSRLQALENLHDGVLSKLSTKLDKLERQFSDNKEAERLMGQIASKFSTLETKLQAASKLSDRVATLETRVSSHSSKHSGMTDLHSRVSKLETQLKPDPEQEEILARINSKLDDLERSRRVGSSRPGISAPAVASRTPAVASRTPAETSRQKELKARIEKLQALRAKYENEKASDDEENI